MQAVGVSIICTTNATVIQEAKAFGRDFGVLCNRAKQDPIRCQRKVSSEAAKEELLKALVAVLPDGVKVAESGVHAINTTCNDILANVVPVHFAIEAKYSKVLILFVNR